MRFEISRLDPSCPTHPIYGLAGSRTATLPGLYRKAANLKQGRSNEGLRTRGGARKLIAGILAEVCRSRTDRSVKTDPQDLKSWANTGPHALPR